jgi:hypothetical protein
MDLEEPVFSIKSSTSGVLLLGYGIGGASEGSDLITTGGIEGDGVAGGGVGVDEF